MPSSARCHKRSILLFRQPDKADSVARTLPEVKQHVRHYVQCHATGAALPGLPDNHLDGSTELWFDDLQALAGVFSSENYMRTIRPDEEEFLDLHACEFLVGEEHELIPEQKK